MGPSTSLLTPIWLALCSSHYAHEKERSCGQHSVCGLLSPSISSHSDLHILHRHFTPAWFAVNMGTFVRLVVPRCYLACYLGAVLSCAFFDPQCCQGNPRTYSNRSDSDALIFFNLCRHGRHLIALQRVPVLEREPCVAWAQHNLFLP